MNRRLEPLHRKMTDPPVRSGSATVSRYRQKTTRPLSRTGCLTQNSNSGPAMLPGGGGRVHTNRALFVDSESGGA